jgi:hypothetical protein
MSNTAGRRDYRIKWKTLIVIMLLLWVMEAPLAGAEEIYSYAIGSGSRVYQYEELLGYYQLNSPAYQKSRVTYRIEALNATLATEGYDTINREYTDVLVKLSELNSTRSALKAYAAETTDSAVLEEIDIQLTAIEAQINQYNKNAGSARVSLAEAKLQEQVAEFYDNNEYLLTSKVQVELKNDFLRKCYGLILMKEQLDYYIAYQSYLNTFREVQAIKYQKGYISQVALEEADANLLKNEVVLLKKQAAYDTSLASIQQETNLGNDISFSFKLSAVRKEYKLEELQTIFLSKNIGLRQLANYTNSYINYRDSGYAKSQALTSQIDLKIRDYDLQEEALRTDIKNYVKEAIASYENSFRTFEMAKSERKLKTKQLEIVTVKKAHKRATELEVNQASYEKEAAEINYFQSYYDIIVWQNILDNHIYGAVP